MQQLARITFNPEVIGGKPCIRGLRVTVSTVVGLMASGRSIEEILQAYPYLEAADIYTALSYAAWRAEEIETDALKTRILEFVEYFNRTMAKPFKWTYKGKPLCD